MKNEEKFQELQLLEQSLQNILMQKQSFQMELSETQSAMKEIDNSEGEVYKIVGQLMIKTEKSRISEELSNKEKILEMRLKKMEQQEESFMEKLEKLREEVINSKSD
ncbi:prefoldin subunit beta [Candidatus Pacearchaeota archaeon]|nr:prefoldin subunit beta [Candidatus Pacearchaeota archaeon]